MGLFQKMRGFINPGAGSSLRVYFGLNNDISSMLDGMSNERLYETQPHLRTVISFLASSIAQTSLKCYTRNDDNDRVRDSSGVLPTLLRNPNPDMTGYELIYALASDLLLNDEALWVVGEDADSPSGFTIRPIPYAWICDYSDGDIFEPGVVTIVNPDTEVLTSFRSDEIIRWHGWKPSDPRFGTSPVTALKQVLGEQVSAWKYREQIWRRGARIPAYISRPKDVICWTDDQATRFKEAWKAAWTGDGSEAGGTPVLEDGMEIKASPSFSFSDAQWAQANTLSLETVCGVYHLNPALVGSSSGQTYASVKENARQLYTETLGPWLRMITDRINTFLLPRIGAPEDEYVEFDLSSKLAGSFEEQASTIQSAVGGPWMTRNEARGRLNLPRIDGGDDLIVPLNVITGGLASPNDTTADSYASMYSGVGVAGCVDDSGADENAGDVDCKSESDERSATIKASDDDSDLVTDVLKSFFNRQRKSVVSKIGAEKSRGASVKAEDETPDWWDADRWNRELADDLFPVVMDLVSRFGRSTLRELAISEELWNSDSTAAYVKKVCEGKARGVNDTTLRNLIASLSDDVPEGDLKATPDGVFDDAVYNRAAAIGAGVATSMSCWGACEAIRQSGTEHDVLKTWVVTSSNPRASHARMNGETVPFDEPFSNGAMFPGDTGSLSVDEVAGCNCVLVLTIPD